MSDYKIINLDEHEHFIHEDAAAINKEYVLNFRIMDKNKPVSIGSGVIISHNLQSYIITAGHVIRQYAEAKAKVIILKNSVFEHTSRWKYMRKDNKVDLDIAYSRIDESELNSLKLKAINKENIVRGKLDVAARKYLGGYPSSKNKKVFVGKKQIDAKYYLIRIIDWKKGKISFCDKNKDHHLFFEYPRKGLTENKVEVDSPLPKGMSGGPLWYSINQFEVNDLKLGGIFIEYHKNNNLLVFTQIRSVLDFIDNTPD